jgi:hypothetical protein
MAKPVYGMSPAQLMSKNPWSSMLQGDPTQADINESVTPAMDMPPPDGIPNRRPAANPYSKQQAKTVADMKQYMDAVNSDPSMQEQKNRLANLDALNAASMGSMNNQVDVSPLLGLIDNFTGSKLASNYQKPMSQAERAQMVMGAAGNTQKSHEALLKDALVQAKMLQGDALSEQRHNQDLSKEGYALDENGNVSVVPGGLAEANIAAKKAGADKALSWADVMSANQGLRRESLDLRKGEQAARASGKFDNDKIIKSSTEQQNKMSLAKHTLETAPVLTPQILNEIQSDIATAISTGGSHAASLEHQKQFSSYAIDFANLKQRITNRPQDIQSPEVRQYMADLVGRLDAAYKQNSASRAKQLATGLSYRSNPEAQDAVSAKVSQYAPAPAAGNKPKTVTQNGHTYTLNEATGDYE